jgi:hypothetical protein
LSDADSSLADDESVIRQTRAWVDRAVIGLNLCPFAKAVQAKAQVHYAVSAAVGEDRLLRDLDRELRDLAAADPVQRDTTLLMAPHCLGDFLAFNDFLDRADRLLVALDLDGILQIASFHPDYQFADAPAGDITNCTNRSPWPTLHLLREGSIDKAVAAYPDPEAIFGRNIETLQRLGWDGWAAVLAGEPSEGTREADHP